MRALILALLLTGPAAAQEVTFQAYRNVQTDRCDLTLTAANKTPVLIDSLTATVEIVSTYETRSLATMRFRLIEPGRDRTEPVWSDGYCEDPTDAAKVAWSKGKGPVPRSAWVRLVSVDSCTVGGIATPNCGARLVTIYPKPGGYTSGMIPVGYEPIAR